MDLHTAATWVYVVFVSLLFGGATFERLVLVSAWSSALPRSVRDWNTNPGLILDPGRFFRFVTLPLLPLTPWMLYVAWASPPSQPRSCLMLSAATLLVALIATFAYYFPALHHLTMKQGGGLDDEQLTRKARAWVLLQYLRLALVGLAWLAALSAFRSGAW